MRRKRRHPSVERYRLIDRIFATKIRACGRRWVILCHYRDTAVLFLWRFRVATMIHEASDFSGTLHGTTSLAVPPNLSIWNHTPANRSCDRPRLIGNICWYPRELSSLIPLMESNDRRTSSSKSRILSFSPRKGRRERERIPREVAMFSEGGGNQSGARCGDKSR